MKVNIDNIIINEDSCTIYPSYYRQLFELVGYIVQGVFFICVQFWILPNRLSMTIYIIIYVLTIIMVGINIKNLIFPPQPIVLTEKGVLVPTGYFVEWERVRSIYFKPGWRTPPVLKIDANKYGNWEILDWYLYTGKKKLIFLFEEYAEKKLYVRTRDKNPSKSNSKHSNKKIK